MTWLTAMEYLCHKWPRICSTCRKHFPVLSSFMTYHRFVTRLTWRVPLVEQERLTLPQHLSSLQVFSGIRVIRSLVLCVCFVDRCISFCTFSFGHYVLCSSSIYGGLITPLVSPSSSLTSLYLSLVIQRCCYGISFCIMISVVKLLQFTITSKTFGKSSKTNKGTERGHLLVALDIKTSFNSNQRSCWCHMLILVLYILTTFLSVPGPGWLNELGSWIT
jgi:hypothetical protein